MNTVPELLANAQLIQIDPADIEIGDRVGFFDEDFAVALGRTIAVFGQRDPIKVRENPKGSNAPWKLVVGRHRLEGCRAEGKKVWAIRVTGKPEDFLDLEASENLDRRHLRAIERAMFVYALAEASRLRVARENGDLNRHKLAAKVRWERVKASEVRAEQAVQEEAEDAMDKMSIAFGWQEKAAEALGRGKREIRRALHLYHMLVAPFPDLIGALAKHPVVGDSASQLKSIADVKDEAARRRVIEQLLADPEIGADDARISAGVDRPAGPAPVQHQKFYDQIEGGWSRLGLGQKRQFIPQLAAMLSTTELKRAMRDRLNEELGE